MDSAREEVLQFYRTHGAEVVSQSEDQDSTDLGKCLAYLERRLGQRQLRRLTVVVLGAPLPPRFPTSVFTRMRRCAHASAYRSSHHHRFPDIEFGVGFAFGVGFDFAVGFDFGVVVAKLLPNTTVRDSRPQRHSARHSPRTARAAWGGHSRDHRDCTRSPACT